MKVNESECCRAIEKVTICDADEKVKKLGFVMIELMD
jgi:hypothetical protein